ncbi:N-acetylglucosamine-6-phosphate deacetylase [Olivibacter sp. SDN3]|uniref:N-acetylglucosamine-6-phosphate deacetylase n=1 Tax=Olivibacter sp. SDN3 TaxID=2764720 RepID=UPI00165173F1|nr:N-acetylglucosamine-6-phosphate deacetylase [Olivibacter sp. SDN3]QNL49622.1 N-acetylglucosamine-6-phosphate deacetylase [Olivibacter sp. SDN3]
MDYRIFAQSVFSGELVLENQLITCANGIVQRIEPGEAGSANVAVENIAPGFFDIQVNGGASFHFTAKPDEESIADIDKACLHDGTAYVLPTLITSSFENIFRGIDAVRNYKKKNKYTGVLGMHLEGPFINPEKRGAHLKKYIQQPNRKQVEELLKYSDGIIVQITVAPEMLDRETLELLLHSGVSVSLGHSNASYAEAASAFNLGINQVTHLFNAMSPFLHRAPGVVGAVFDNAEVFAPIVLDGKHIDYATARIAHKIKKDKLFLISDALFLGREKQSFQWEEFDAQLLNDEYLNSDGNLAGASISLAEAVRNAIEQLDISVQEAVEMATVRPAEVMGMANKIGKIKAGYPARFTVFDKRNRNFRVLTAQ